MRPVCFRFERDVDESIGDRERDCDRGVLHSRLRLKASEQIVRKCEPLLRRGVLRARKRNFGLDDVFDLKAGADFGEFREATQQEAGGDEQSRASAISADASCCGRGARLSFRPNGRLHAEWIANRSRDQKCGHEADGAAREDGESESESEHGIVDSNAVDPRKPGGRNAVRTWTP